MTLRSGTPEEAGFSPHRIDRIRRRAQKWVEDGETRTLVVLAARRGIIALHEAHGRVAPEPDAPPTQLNTIFPMSSISKVITATAVMVLVDEGLVGLNRPVVEYVPAYFVGEDKAAVMVHHLLTHTSGWDEDEVEAYAAERAGSVSLPPVPRNSHPAIHEALFLRRDAPLTRSPGTEMSYCSQGFDLLGEIVRTVSGQALEEFARERIFEPLGMTDTFYSPPRAVIERCVRRRPLHPPPFGLDDPEYLTQPWPESGVLSTARDMAAFGQLFLTGGAVGERQIISSAAVAEMTRDQIPGIPGRFLHEIFPDGSWGLGWGVHGDKKAQNHGSLYSPAAVDHGGSGGVYLWVDPVYEIVGIYFSVWNWPHAPAPGAPEPRWNIDLFSNAITAAVETNTRTEEHS
jgi:CubicO group peptidase (beta-lactamase class C family)